MAVTFQNSAPTAAPANAIDCVQSEPEKKTRKRHAGPIDPPKDWESKLLRLRVGHLLIIYGVSNTVFYEMLREHQIPAPSGKDGRPYWLSTVIAAHLRGE